MMSKNSRITKKAVIIAALMAGFMSPTAEGAPKAGLDTPADTIHPGIHGKVGQGDGTNANPNGANENGGNIHGIANVYGKNGNHPKDGAPGFADELTNVHGGIDAYNKNALP